MRNAADEREEGVSLTALQLDSQCVEGGSGQYIAADAIEFLRRQRLNASDDRLGQTTELRLKQIQKQPTPSLLASLLPAFLASFKPPLFTAPSDQYLGSCHLRLLSLARMLLHRLVQNSE